MNKTLVFVSSIYLKDDPNQPQPSAHKVTNAVAYNVSSVSFNFATKH